MKNKLVLGLGSNLGNRYAYLYQAKLAIEKELGTAGTLSKVYTSPPWGDVNQPGFLNAAFAIETDKNAADCFTLIKNIEKELGRIHIKRWGPRCIDIDILFYNDEIIELEYLTIPHKNIAERAFVLAPLADIVPDFEHPLLNKTMIKLLQNLDNNCSLFT